MVFIRRRSRTAGLDMAMVTDSIGNDLQIQSVVFVTSFGRRREQPDKVYDLQRTGITRINSH